MSLIILKAAITVALILALTWIAERTSPRIAGILSGYPVGTALVLFFYAIQSGPAFAVASVPYNLLGHSSALMFAYCYFLGARSSGGKSILSSSLLALAGYGVIAIILSRVQLTLSGSAAVSAMSISLFSFLLRKGPNYMIRQRINYTLSMILFRITFSTMLVFSITGLAQNVGVKWAGIFSAFPLVVFPVVLLIHIVYGHEQARTVLKNFPRGLWTVLIYSLTISWTYGRFGVYLGTLIGYLVATAVLLAMNYKVFMDERGRRGRFST
jgi:hypothetical protein